MLKALEVFAFEKTNGNPGAIGIMEFIASNIVPYHLPSVLTLHLLRGIVH